MEQLINNVMIIYNEICKLDIRYFKNDFKNKQKMLTIIANVMDKLEEFKEYSHIRSKMSDAEKHVELLNEIYKQLVDNNEEFDFDELRGLRVRRSAEDKKAYLREYQRSKQDSTLHHCPICNIDIKYYSIPTHNKSLKHQRNLDDQSLIE